MAPLPFFYFDQLSGVEGPLTLDEDNSRHIAQALRMKEGEPLLLTDGKGHTARAAIVNPDRRRCVVDVKSLQFIEKPQPEVTIAISLLKNTHRMEWFLEKATEIGVTKIVLLVCKRTEKEKFRQERLQAILTSALLQSRQAWIPELHPPVRFQEFVESKPFLDVPQRFMAHCSGGPKKLLRRPDSKPSLILIGPEGDFTDDEIGQALSRGCQHVSLGDTRLRTETAGVVAATLLKLGNPMD